MTTTLEGDVAAVLALEPTLHEALKALRKVAPALDRLAAAGYPGADELLGLRPFIGAPMRLSDAVSRNTTGSVANLLHELDRMKRAAGDVGAWEHDYYCRQLGYSIDWIRKDVGPETADQIEDYLARSGQTPAALARTQVSA